MDDPDDGVYARSISDTPIEIPSEAPKAMVLEKILERCLRSRRPLRLGARALGGVDLGVAHLSTPKY
jgi:hypothetical protein